MDLTEYPILSYLTLFLGIISGLIGGWMFQRIAAQVSDFRLFKNAAITMYLADFFILAAALIAYGGSLLEFTVLALVMFSSPAVTFLAAERFRKLRRFV